MSAGTLQLKILLPTEVALDHAVSSVVAEAQNGSFCLLPRHVDFVTALASGILSYHDQAGEHFVAIDSGTLVKCGTDVLVSTRHAVRGDDLNQLKSLVEDEFHALDDQERRARTALARLEAGTLRGFMKIRGTAHEG